MKAMECPSARRSGSKENRISEYPKDFGKLLQIARQFSLLAYAVQAGNIIAVFEATAVTGQVLHNADGDNEKKAADNHNRQDLNRLQNTYDVDIATRHIYRRTPLHKAACANDIDALEWLYSQGADINALDIDG